MICKGDSIISSLDQTLKTISDKQDINALLISYSINVEDKLREEISNFLEDNYSDIEVEYIEGGQHVFDLLIGIS